MRTARRAGIAMALAVGVVLVAAVASANPGDPDTPVAYVPPSDVPAPPTTPQLVEPRPGMVDVIPTAFDTATIGDDDRTVTITFWGGIEPCSVLDRVDIAYGPDAVTVTLYQGSDPTAGDVACIEIAVQKQVIVVLDESLGGRAIVDGTAS